MVTVEEVDQRLEEIQQQKRSLNPALSLSVPQRRFGSRVTRQNQQEVNNAILTARENLQSLNSDEERLRQLRNELISQQEAQRIEAERQQSIKVSNKLLRRGKQADALRNLPKKERRQLEADLNEPQEFRIEGFQEAQRLEPIRIIDTSTGGIKVIGEDTRSAQEIVKELNKPITVVSRADIRPTGFLNTFEEAIERKRSKLATDQLRGDNSILSGIKRTSLSFSSIGIEAAQTLKLGGKALFTPVKLKNEIKLAKGDRSTLQFLKDISKENRQRQEAIARESPDFFATKLVGEYVLLPRALEGGLTKSLKFLNKPIKTTVLLPSQRLLSSVDKIVVGKKITNAKIILSQVDTPKIVLKQSRLDLLLSQSKILGVRGKVFIAPSRVLTSSVALKINRKGLVTFGGFTQSGRSVRKLKDITGLIGGRSLTKKISLPQIAGIDKRFSNSRQLRLLAQQLQVKKGIRTTNAILRKKNLNVATIKIKLSGKNLQRKVFALSRTQRQPSFIQGRQEFKVTTALRSVRKQIGTVESDVSVINKLSRKGSVNSNVQALLKAPKLKTLRKVQTFKAAIVRPAPRLRPIGKTRSISSVQVRNFGITLPAAKQTLSLRQSSRTNQQSSTKLQSRVLQRSNQRISQRSIQRVINTQRSNQALKINTRVTQRLRTPQTQLSKLTTITNIGIPRITTPNRPVRTTRLPRLRLPLPSLKRPKPFRPQRIKPQIRRSDRILYAPDFTSKVFNIRSPLNIKSLKRGFGSGLELRPIPIRNK